MLLTHTFTGEPSSYYRELDISNATSTTRFKIAGTEYSREIFVSAPDQIMVIRLKASKKEY